MKRVYASRGERRVTVDFSVTLRKKEVHFPLKKGVTVNLSQNGALIGIDSQEELQINDQIMLTFKIPTSFSGQESTVFLQGSGVIVRLDRARRAVAAQFDSSFKMFKPIHET